MIMMIRHRHGQLHCHHSFVLVLLSLLVVAAIVPIVSARRRVDRFPFIEIEELPAGFKAIGFEGDHDDDGSVDVGDKECLSIVDIICSLRGGFDIACQLFASLEWKPFTNYTAFVPTDVAFEEFQQQPQYSSWNLTAATPTNMTLQLLYFHLVDNNQTLLVDELQCQELTSMSNGQDTRTVCLSRNDNDKEIDKFQKGGDNSDPIPIIIADLPACNGIIHILDGVLLPDGIDASIQQPYGGTIDMDDMEKPVSLPTASPTTHTPTSQPSPIPQQQQQPPLPPPPSSSSSTCIPIMDFVCGSHVVSKFCDLLRLYDLQDDLQDVDSITLFAPYNLAFRQEEDVNLDSIDFDTARDVLIFHASRRIVPAASSRGNNNNNNRHNKHNNNNNDEFLQCSELLPMANGKDTRTYCSGVNTFQKGDGNPLDKMPKLIVKNIAVCNGLVHIVDRVLLPYELPMITTRGRI